MANIMLSFIIPAYNSEKYIRYCLDSVFDQTNGNYEVIVINDGSTDNTQSILEEYIRIYKERIRVFSQKNQGISAARNKGVIEARGEYITFIDHDDQIEKNYVEDVISAINEGCYDVLTFGHDRIDALGNIIGRYPVSKNVEWARWGVCTVWLLVAKRSIYIENNIRFPVGLFNEDVPVSINVAYYSTNFGILNKILYHYRVYTGNTCSKIHSKFELSPNSRSNVFLELKRVEELVEQKKYKKLIIYNAIKFYYGILLVFFQNETKDNLLDEYNKYTEAICGFFPDYKKFPISIFYPRGELLKKRAAVFVSLWLDRVGLFKWFLLLVNRKL